MVWLLNCSVTSRERLPDQLIALQYEQFDWGWYQASVMSNHHSGDYLIVYALKIHHKFRLYSYRDVPNQSDTWKRRHPLLFGIRKKSSEYFWTVNIDDMLTNYDNTNIWLCVREVENMFHLFFFKQISLSPSSPSAYKKHACPVNIIRLYSSNQYPTGFIIWHCVWCAHVDITDFTCHFFEFFLRATRAWNINPDDLNPQTLEQLPNDIPTSYKAIRKLRWYF